MFFRQSTHILTVLATLAITTLYDATAFRIYSFTEVCSAEMNLADQDMHAGIITLNTSTSLMDKTTSPCRMYFLTQYGFKIGIRVLADSTISLNESVCLLKFLPDLGFTNNTLCLWNFTSQIEVISVENACKLTLEINELNVQESDPFNVLFYTFTYATGDNICQDSSTRLCDESTKCVHISVFEHLQQYNICKVHLDEQTSPSESEGSFLGVAVFCGVLAFLLSTIVVLQFFHRRSLCTWCRVILCMDDDDASRDRNVTASSERPRFHLDALPPNYSDLSDFESYQNSQTRTANTTIDQEVQRREQEHINEHRNVSFGAVSTTSTLPPSYSDVIIHQDKYHVHL